MRTNDLQVLFENEAIELSKRYSDSFVKKMIGPNDVAFWVVCRLSFLGRLVFLRDSGYFE